MGEEAEDLVDDLLEWVADDTTDELSDVVSLKLSGSIKMLQLPELCRGQVNEPIWT